MTTPKKIISWLSRREAIRQNRVGPEKPDPTPVEIPARCQRPPSLKEEMQHFIKQEISQQAVAAHRESFEESDDFDVDDEYPDMISQYTVTELEPEELGFPVDPVESSSSSDEPAPENGSEATGAEGADSPAPSPVSQTENST